MGPLTSHIRRPRFGERHKSADREPGGFFFRDAAGDITAASSARSPRRPTCENVEEWRKILARVFFFLLSFAACVRASLFPRPATHSQPVTSIFHIAVSVSGNFAALIYVLCTAPGNCRKSESPLWFISYRVPLFFNRGTRQTQVCMFHSESY